jgi:hypothetical protein
VKKATTKPNTYTHTIDSLSPPLVSANTNLLLLLLLKKK